MDTYEPEHPHLKIFGKKKKKAVKKRRAGSREIIKLVMGGEEYLDSLDMDIKVKQLIMAKSFSIYGDIT